MNCGFEFLDQYHTEGVKIRDEIIRRNYRSFSEANASPQITRRKKKFITGYTHRRQTSTTSSIIKFVV
jgi:hypothetical protein